MSLLMIVILTIAITAATLLFTFFIDWIQNRDEKENDTGLVNPAPGPEPRKYKNKHAA